MYGVLSLRSKAKTSHSSEIKTGDVAEKIVLLLHHAEVVPAQPVVERKPRCYTETVLNVETKIVLIRVAGRIPEVLETAGHISREKVLQRIASETSVEFQPSTEVFIEILLHRSPVEIDAKLHVVLVELPGEVVEDLIVAVDPGTRDTAGRPQLRHTADQDDG